MLFQACHTVEGLVSCIGIVQSGRDPVISLTDPIIFRILQKHVSFRAVNLLTDPVIFLTDPVIFEILQKPVYFRTVTEKAHDVPQR